MCCDLLKLKNYESKTVQVCALGGAGEQMRPGVGTKHRAGNAVCCLNPAHKCCQHN